MADPLSLVEALAHLPDPRCARGQRHPLVAALSLAVVATLAGMKTLEAIAQFGRDHGRPLAHALGFRTARTPCKAFYSLLFRALDAAALEQALSRWLAPRLPAAGVVALDGKSLRGSAGGGLPGLHLLAAYVPQAAAVLGQLPVAATTTEHKTALRLLGILPLGPGMVVSADAAFTHRDVCAAIRAKGADYVLPVKDNQAILQADIAAMLAPQAGFSPLPAPAAASRAATGQPTGQGPRAAGAAHAGEYNGAE